MRNTSLTIKTPGKLMVAGEFAVLEPYHDLVVMAVDRFVYARLEESDTNRLSLEDFGLHDLNWSFGVDGIEVDGEDDRVLFVQSAMSIACTYLNEKGITPTPFHLSIRSELDDASGAKYGLGSSAAVTVSVVKAILQKHLPDSPREELVFRLASISHVTIQGNGSGADVAASSYGGFLRYASFQAEWLQEAYAGAATLHGLLEKDWPYFSLEPVRLPDDIYVCVGWTGKPASTKRLVDEILKLKTSNTGAFHEFLASSEQAVGNFLTGMQNADTELLLEGIRKNRHALRDVGRAADTAIETPLLETLCDLAETHGGAGKPSGAGGGDCGIAFMPSREQAERLMEAWGATSIRSLKLKPFSYGAEVVE
ncbi:phosphomevalonate kinase [Lentibacillus sediminis]|uniref:phosphomevalonate kinase n=1 Tax=Lentibacillus sediminis TaxID=1940529 RepID=UPI000C1BA8F9|nr:phosphomevalonate kinase [Lentibacillus sediminis]